MKNLNKQLVNLCHLHTHTNLMLFSLNQRLGFLKSLLDLKIDSWKKAKFINLEFLHQMLHFDLIPQPVNLISYCFDKPILVFFSEELEWKLNSSFWFYLMSMKHDKSSDYWRRKLFTQNISHDSLRRHIKNSSLFVHLLTFIDRYGVWSYILNHNIKLQFMNIK